MPWLEISPMDQRKQLIKDYQRGLQSVTELADRFEISRKTVYKWIDRHELDGANGLVNHSRRPRSCPHATAQGIVDAVLDARRHHPLWGAKKLLRILRRKDPRETWPARTTVCDLLKRHDLDVLLANSQLCRKHPARTYIAGDSARIRIPARFHSGSAHTVAFNRPARRERRSCPG